MVDFRTKYDMWDYTTSRTESRKRLKRLRSKARRNLIKQYLKNINKWEV